MTDGSIAYCDQSYTWTDFPPEVDGVLVDFIVVADADNAVADYGLSITVDNPGSILLFIDPMVDVGVDMSWVIDDGYTEQDTIHFSLDKGGSTVVFDLWVRDISDVANPIITGPQNDGNASNYGVAYATDEADLSVTLSDDPDPYVIDSGVNWTRTYMIENLGPGDTDEIVVTLSGAGITGSTFVSVFNTPQLHL